MLCKVEFMLSDPSYTETYVISIVCWFSKIISISIVRVGNFSRILNYLNRHLLYASFVDHFCKPDFQLNLIFQELFFKMKMLKIENKN